MKRHPALTQLSREHHPALVLAKRAQQMAAGKGEEVERLMAEIGAIFDRELEPHFRLEEDRLLPQLRQAGQLALVERTLAEHAELRTLVGRLGLGDIASLPRFGEKLAAHVRFEERELFAVAESLLTPEQLPLVDHETRNSACRLPTPH